MTVFRRCAREWHWRYRERLEPLIPPEALTRGKRIHQALAHWWSRHSSAPPKLLEMSPADRAMMRGYSAFWQAPSLADVQVDVPFHVELDGVTVVGSLDAIGVEKKQGPIDFATPVPSQVIVEHKTTSSDISPGSSYWRQVTLTAMQPSIYLLAFPGASVLWDALRKPSLRQLEANTQRKEPETDQAFEARMVESMAADPTKYFARQTIVRLEEETLETVADIQQTGRAMIETPRMPARNPDACWSFGRACDFFGLCWEGRTIQDSGDTLARKDTNHTEDVGAPALELRGYGR